jgi:hypothetical protein
MSAGSRFELGVSLRTLVRRLSAHGLPRPRLQGP